MTQASLNIHIKLITKDILTNNQAELKIPIRKIVLKMTKKVAHFKKEKVLIKD